MDLITKRFSKLTYTVGLEDAHIRYKKCVANVVESYMKDGIAPEGEVCLDEKRSFYDLLHEVNKTEHDIISQLSYDKILTAREYQ